VTDVLDIQSHAGPYQVHFLADVMAVAEALPASDVHIIVDANVARLYAEPLARILALPSVLAVDATEGAKSLEAFPAYVRHLVERKARRDHVLVAIGGGITQDITCFLAATFARGMDWWFVPTTLLAQADSCIGSKSSVNCGEAKNILGTFTPPRRVLLSTAFLRTLDERELRSGAGEIIKAHVIEGPNHFDELAGSYARLFGEPAVMESFIRRSLAIKKGFIEEDEFDRARRNLFNYGHSFGHAIESATDYAIPHGIAVALGMDMANFVAWRLGAAGPDPYYRMHAVMKANYRGFESTPVPMERFLAAIGKDKKNSGADTVTLILPDGDGRVFRRAWPGDAGFRAACARFLDSERSK
jgi:3-dehydroquinate synthase